jgi:outer membrane protein
MRANVWSVVLTGLALAAAIPAAAEVKVAVIDVQRVVSESDPGKGTLQKLKAMQDQKLEKGKALQQEMDTLRDQYHKHRFTLSDEKLHDLEKQIEDKGIDLKRFQDDASRELDEARRREFDALEAKIMPIINQLGKEQGFTLIFNKFQSGLVYADDAVDITDEVIHRFNTAP